MKTNDEQHDNQDGSPKDKHLMRYFSSDPQSASNRIIITLNPKALIKALGPEAQNPNPKSLNAPNSLNP